MRVLGKKAVARMDRLRTGKQRGFNDALFVQIAFRCGRRTDAIAVIRQLHVQGLPVGLRIDGHGGDAHLLAGTDDADRDLAAVRD